MPKFMVSMYYEERGWAIVEAKNEKEARKIAEEKMGDEGNFIEEQTDRSWGVFDVTKK
jgi:hypothetical protein